MQYALVDGKRVEAFKGGRGICESETCAKTVVAKCGPRVIHHWAHLSIRDCDPWHENETPWHREWKSHFPEECRERPRYADDGEVHRADVVTPTGIFVEVQNSPLSDVERQSREKFYRNLVWIVNGKKFASRFHLLHVLPDPDSELAHDLVWFKARKDMRGAAEGMFWRRSENPGVSANKGEMVRVHGLTSIKNEVLASYSGHHQFDWINPREGWLEATVPVFFDFGGDWVWRLLKYDERGLLCVRKIVKAELLHDLMHETDALNVATGTHSTK